MTFSVFPVRWEFGCLLVPQLVLWRHVVDFVLLVVIDAFLLFMLTEVVPVGVQNYL